MDYFIVAVGGFFGAIFRIFIVNFVDAKLISYFPAGTLLVNLTGCFLLGLFMTITAEKLKLEPKFRTGIATGFLGAYTTFSAFAVESVNLYNSEMAGLSLIYVFATPIGSIMFCWAGFRMGQMISAGKKEKPESS